MKFSHIYNAALVLPSSILKHSSLTLKDSKIAAINKPAPKDAALINARGLYLAPGFIDTHIHGSPDDIISHETRYGTTASVIAVSCGRPVPKISEYPNILGVRLEGPYINPVMAGAQDKRFIRQSFHSGIGITEIRSDPGMRIDWFHSRNAQGDLAVKMMTLAPELPGAERLIRLCKQKGVISSIGHSDASYAEAKRSFKIGVRHATHLFNAMSGPRHGTAGAGFAALFDKRVTVEVIADLKHVRPGLLRLVFTVKDPDNIILVTDSVRAPSSGHKTGSRITMMDAVKNVVTHCGLSLPSAVRMASTNPARLFGVAGRKGSIAPGKDADLVLFDKNFNVEFVIIGGRIVYQKRGLRKRCAE
ncbi:MAG: amidohydrolase family protein [Candidatus Omnitrophica bacterium]|nr:amidohydrolase family protein [Candidatus Omnitrophota bacterium]